jgi:TonB family protein
VIICIALLSCSSAFAQANAQPPAQSNKSKPSAKTLQSLQMLTPDEGIDFSKYLTGLFTAVKRNWILQMPESAMLGEKGIVVVRFQIQKDGKLGLQIPFAETSSGKKLLDEAALKSIRGSAPFAKLPENFSGPYIELRCTFFYNMAAAPPPSR